MGTVCAVDGVRAGARAGLRIRRRIAGGDDVSDVAGSRRDSAGRPGPLGAVWGPTPGRGVAGGAGDRSVPAGLGRARPHRVALGLDPRARRRRPDGLDPRTPGKHPGPPRETDVSGRIDPVAQRVEVERPPRGRTRSARRNRRRIGAGTARRPHRHRPARAAVSRPHVPRSRPELPPPASGGHVREPLRRQRAGPARRLAVALSRTRSRTRHRYPWPRPAI